MSVDPQLANAEHDWARASHAWLRGWGWVALGLVGLGCAPKTGWERTDQRACAPDAPATLCVDADPDRPLKVDLGGTTLVAGECAVAPEPDASGRLGIVTTDGAGQSTKHRIRIARSTMTRVAVDGEGELTLVSRDACDASVPAAR